MSYIENVLLRWTAALQDAQVVNDVHIVQISSTTGARTQPTSTTCPSLGPDDSAILGDHITATTALCRHMRPLLPPEVLS